ncbi:MAG: hypothetical protein ACYDEX_24470 [Mobilitalea sp.]
MNKNKKVIPVILLLFCSVLAYSVENNIIGIWDIINIYEFENNNVTRLDDTNGIITFFNTGIGTIFNKKSNEVTKLLWDFDISNNKISIVTKENKVEGFINFNNDTMIMSVIQDTESSFVIILKRNNE